MGFRHAAVGALVRSSYHADRQAEEVSRRRVVRVGRSRSVDACGRRRRSVRPQDPHPPLLRIRPASRPASSPKPQKKSARTAPAIAPPVSCAIISRCSGVVGQRIGRREIDRRAERDRARIDGDRALARAAARPACRSDRRSAPRACRAAAAALRERRRSSDSRRGAAAAARDASAPFANALHRRCARACNSPRSISTRPSERNGWPFWSA